MANEYSVNQADLKAVADAIREKGGTSDALEFPNGFVDAVEAIQVGTGGESIDEDLIALINGTMTDFVVPNGVERITSYRFYGLKSLRSVDLRNLTVELQGYAFNECSALETVIMPDSLSLATPLGSRLFLNCISLKKFEYSGTGTAYSAVSSMFQGCTALEEVKMPYFSFAGAGAIFNGCTSLRHVDMLGRIGNNFFNNCAELKTIVIRSSNVGALSNVSAFTGTPFASGGSGGTIYIPKALYDELGTGSTNDYKAATNWSMIDAYGTITWAQIEGSEYE